MLLRRRSSGKRRVVKMCSGCRGAFISASALLWLWALAPAHAQLPRVGGGSVGNVGLPGSSLPSAGGSGSGLPGSSSSGLPGSSGGSSFSSVPDNSISLGVRIPTDFGDATKPTLPRVDPLGALPKPGTITNSLANPSSNARGPVARQRTGVPPAGERRFMPDEVVVRLPSTVSAQALDDLARRHRLARIESHSIGLAGSTFHRWRITDRRSVSEVIRALEEDGAIGSAQPNYRFTLQQSEPSSQNGVGAMQFALTKLRVTQAHGLSTGNQVLVAVIDSGIDTSHPEIANMVAGSFDAVNSREPPDSHGTAMAGAIVAHAKLKGVAPAARILAIRAFTKTEGTTLSILRSLDWAAAHGARIINMSFAGPRDPEIATSLAAALKKGIVLIASAGNAGRNAAPLYPAADPNVIAVTAIDAEDHLLSVANRGRHIAVAAPGVDIVGPGSGGGYQMSTGTSVAAAHVSGVGALLIAFKPTLTPDAIRKLLASTATDLGPKGRDDQFGAGLVDAYRALISLNPANAARPKTNNSVDASVAR
jgi:subtilisin family serine protease